LPITHAAKTSAPKYWFEMNFDMQSLPSEKSTVDSSALAPHGSRHAACRQAGIRRCGQLRREERKRKAKHGRVGRGRAGQGRARGALRARTPCEVCPCQPHRRVVRGPDARGIPCRQQTSDRHGCEKPPRPLFSTYFSYVCPEPVLVTCSIVRINVAQKRNAFFFSYLRTLPMPVWLWGHHLLQEKKTRVVSLLL
jgi:hypothetical protein